MLIELAEQTIRQIDLYISSRWKFRQARKLLVLIIYMMRVLSGSVVLGFY